MEATITARAPTARPHRAGTFIEDVHQRPSLAARSAPRLASMPGACAAGSDEIRVGLIGCGGRGTGAVENVLQGAEGVRLVAMGDMFPDRLDDSLREPRRSTATRSHVPPIARSSGCDAYKKVIASDVNYVILATPPGLPPDAPARPPSRPARTSSPRSRSPWTARHQDVPRGRRGRPKKKRPRRSSPACSAATTPAYLETMKRIQDGAIGDIVAARVYWNQGGLWTKPRKPEWTDMEWQLRNWLLLHLALAATTSSSSTSTTSTSPTG